jgi:hypothetical protein
MQEAVDTRRKTSFRGNLDANARRNLGEKSTTQNETRGFPPPTRSITYVMCNYLPLRIRLVRYPSSGASYFHRRHSP